MSDIRENVKRLIAAGVPEEEIGKYIQQFSGQTPSVSGSARDDYGLSSSHQPGGHVAPFNAQDTARSVASPDMQWPLDTRALHDARDLSDRYLGQLERREGLIRRDLFETAGGLTDMFRQGAALASPVPIQIEDKNYREKWADALDLPKPETNYENVVAKVGGSAALAAATLGIGNAIRGATFFPSLSGRLPMVPSPLVRTPAFSPSLLRPDLPAQGVPWLQTAGAFLSAMPKTQLASSALSGAAVAGAQNSGAPVEGQLMAGLAAGAIPSVGNVIGSLGARTLAGTHAAAKAFTPSGQQRMAGEALRRMARDPDAALAALRRGGDELVPGSLPTTAQVTGDSGLAVLEKGLASSGPQGALIQDRMLAQHLARQNEANRLLRSHSPHGGNLAVDDVGTRVRDAYDTNYGTARARTREAYAAIDPDGTTSFDLEPLVESFQRSIGNRRYQRTPAEINSFMRQMQDDIKDSVNVTYADLQDIRTSLTEMAEQAGRTGDAATARIAGLMKGNLDDYLENATTGFSPAQGALFREAKRSRQIQGKRFESGANEQMMKRGNSIEGQKVPTNLVPETYFRGGERGAESMRAFNLAAGGNREAREAMQDYAVSRALGKLKTYKDESLNLRQLDTWAKTHAPALRQLGKENLAALPNVRADILRAQRATARAGVQGSPTAQNFATQSIIDRFAGVPQPGDTVSSGVLTGISHGIGNKLSGWLFTAPNEAVKEILIAAAVDPKRALRLMQNVPPSQRPTVMKMLKENMQAYGAATPRVPALLSPEWWGERAQDSK